MKGQAREYLKKLSSVLNSSQVADRLTVSTWALSWSLSIGCLIVAFHKVNLRDSLRQLYSFDRFFFGLSIAITLFGLCLKAIRWRALFGPHNRPPLRRLFTVSMAGQMINATVPARAGDLARAFFLGRFASRSFALTTVIIEKGIDAAFVLILAGVTVLFGPSATWTQWSKGVLGLALLVASLTAVFLTVALGKPNPTLIDRIVSSPGIRRLGLGRRLPYVLAALNVLRDPLRVLVFLLWSVAIWFLGYLSVWSAMKAVSLNTSWTGPILVLVIQHLGAPIPSVGRVGTHQALSIFALSLLGVPSESAAAFSIILYLSAVAVPILIGAGCLWFEIRIAGRPGAMALCSNDKASGEKSIMGPPR